MNASKSGRDRAPSARRQAAPQTPRQATPAARRPRAAARRLALWIPALVVLAIAAIVVYRALAPSAPRAPVAALPDSIAGMDPRLAYDRAVALGRQERDGESLPYYRRAIAGVRVDFWQLHSDYASALYNLTRRPRTRHGLAIPTLRSTCEQVEYMQRAWRELEVAETLARDPRDLAKVKDLRARMLEVWGLPWETFVALRQARDLDPSRKDIATQGDRYMDLMRVPDQVPRK